MWAATLSRDLLEGAHDADALDDHVGALVDDDVDAGHDRVGVDDRLAAVKVASRRSMSTPAHQAKAWCRGGTSHAPLRLTPPMTAIDVSYAWWPAATRAAGGRGAAGRRGRAGPW